jgi:hypothetical protein
LLFSGWGIPVVDTRAVTTALEDAGFTVVRAVPNALAPLTGVILARRPVG